MKTTTTNKFLLGLLAVGALTLNSCKKEEAVVTKNENTKAVTFSQVAAKQASFVQTTYNLTNFISAVVKQANVGFKTADDDSIPCLTYTVDSLSNPHTLTMDFGGSTGCKSVNGVDYKGLVVVEYTSTDISVVGTSFKATATGFRQGDMYLDGDITISNEGPSPAGNPVGKIATNLTTKYADDEIQFAGVNTFFFEFAQNNPADDSDNTIVYTGSGSGTTTDGLQFNQTITTDLITKDQDGCLDHFSSGHLLVQSPSFPDKDIDYGNGTCDNVATVTDINGTTTITLQ